jgi:hypothetical protein
LGFSSDLNDFTFSSSKPFHSEGEDEKITENQNPAEPINESLHNNQKMQRILNEISINLASKQ